MKLLPAYKNEEAVGESIKSSGIPRESLFITTKVTGLPGQDVEAAFSSSLQKLGTDYVDLYLIHLPYVAPDEITSFWSQLEAIHATGRARSIGVSNFLQKHLDTLLEKATVKPAINQIEYHPYLQHGDLVRYCQERGIPVSAYGVLTAITKARPGPVDAIYAELAAKYGVGENDIAVKWCVDQGIAVITTSSNPERLNGFRDSVAKFTLAPEEIQRISELGQEKHYRAVYGGMMESPLRFCWQWRIKVLTTYRFLFAG